MGAKSCGIDPFQYLTDKFREIVGFEPSANKGEVLATCIKVDASLMESLSDMEDRLCAWARERKLPVLIAVFSNESIDCPVLVTGKGLEEFDRDDPRTRRILLGKTGWPVLLSVALEETKDSGVRVRLLRELLKYQIEELANQ